MKNRYQLDMTSGALASKIVRFAVPLMTSSILQLLFNAADIVVVGRYAGSESLAAVGSTSSLINLLVSLFMGLSVGSNVVVARELGKGEMEKVRKGAHTAIFLALCGGVILMGIGVIFSGSFLKLMSSPEDVIELATLYMRIYFLGMPAMLLYNFGSSLLRAQGDTKRPLYFLTAAGIINVCLNLFFVIVLQMGVAGVALATAISQYVSAALILKCLLTDEGALRINPKELRPEPELVRQILQVGLPAGFQSVVFSISNVLIQSTINDFGSTVMSGSAASSSIEGFVYVAMNAFAQTAITFVSQNYGAGERKRVDKTVLYCLGMVIAVGLLLGNVVYFFGVPLLSIYAPGKTAVIEAGLVRMTYAARPYLFCGMMDVLANVLRGLGSSLTPMIVSLLGACGLRIVWVYTIFPLDPTPANLFLSYPVSWLLTACVHALMLVFVRKRAFQKLDPSAANP